MKETTGRAAGWCLASALSILLACGGEASDTGEPPASPAGADLREPATDQSAGGEAGGARVEGRASYQGEIPRLPTLKMDADPACRAMHPSPVPSRDLVLGPDSALANVLVWVKNAPARPPPVEPVVLDQRGCLYVPRVAGVVVGQKLQVLNSDGVLHNVHTLSKSNTSINRAMPPVVLQMEHSFEREEFPILFKCDVHPWMSAYVAVMTHPYFAVTGADGRYSISGLPAGVWEIGAWHERLGELGATVSLDEGATGPTDFSFVR